MGADEESGADLGVGQAVPGKPCDLGFLRGQFLAGGGGGLGGALAGGFAGGQQLAAGPFGECLHLHRVQHAVGGTQLVPSLRAAALAAQPLAVQQVGAGELGAKLGTAQSVNRLLVQAIGRVVLGHQRA